VTVPPASTITFNPGSAQSTANGQMVPGGTDRYYVLAKAGQTMSVSVTSATPSLSFRVYRPDTTLAKAADGSPLIEGKTLPDAGPADNAQAWVGAIPRDGNYLITVGMGPSGPLVPTPYALTVALQ
jgi:cytochrome c1